MPTTPEDKSELLKGHRERLRQRLLDNPAMVADYEVLELLLGLVIPRRDTKLLALEIIRKFNGLRGALDARPDELLQISGFGPSLMSLWRLLREIMARYAEAPLQEREILASPEAVARIARQRLANLVEEEFWMALVDSQNRLIFWERVKRGGVSSVAVQPRDIIETALLHKASGLILIHNHPGGSPKPSRADIILTEEIQQLAPRLGLRMLDHVIVTAGECYSISQKSILP